MKHLFFVIAFLFALGSVHAQQSGFVSNHVVVSGGQSGVTSADDTPSVDLDISGGTLTADVRLNPSPSNALQETLTGLLVTLQSMTLTQDLVDGNGNLISSEGTDLQTALNELAQQQVTPTGNHLTEDQTADNDRNHNMNGHDYILRNSPNVIISSDEVCIGPPGLCPPF